MSPPHNGAGLRAGAAAASNPPPHGATALRFGAIFSTATSDDLERCASPEASERVRGRAEPEQMPRTSRSPETLLQPLSRLGRTTNNPTPQPTQGPGTASGTETNERLSSWCTAKFVDQHRLVRQDLIVMRSRRAPLIFTSTDPREGDAPADASGDGCSAIGFAAAGPTCGGG